MTEIIRGKRTLIERDGNVFELPRGHTIEREDLEDGTTRVTLTAFTQWGTFDVLELEEIEDRIIVHLGDYRGGGGPAGGDVLESERTYPFPSPPG